MTVVAEPVPAEILAGTDTVLTQSTVEQSESHDLAELLRTTSVVHLSQSGSKGSLTTVSLRSAKPNFTLVLLNGTPVNDIGDLLGGAFNFATLGTDNVQSVDILRGPLSSVYGSEAVGGVISITTLPPLEQPMFRLQSDGGNFGATSTLASTSLRTGKLSVSLSGGYERMGQQVLDDGFQRRDSMLRADLDLGSKAHADSFLYWDRLGSNSFPVSSGGPMYALSRQIETDQADQLVGGVHYQRQVNAQWFSTMAYDIFSRVAYNNTPAIFDSIPPGPAYVPQQQGDTRFLRQRAVFVERFQPRQWLQFDGVGQFRYESGKSTGTIDAVLPASYMLTRPTGFLSFNATVMKSGFVFTAGLGVETSNTYHTVLSPRAGASYTFGATRLRASWGQGFKLPSFYSLGSPLVGNPSLLPEFSTGFDAGIEHRFQPAHINVALSGFNTRYKGLIDFSPSVFRLVNRSAAFGRGVELEANAQWHRTTFGGSVSYIDAGLEDTTEQLRDVPRWSEDLHVTTPLSSRLLMTWSTVWVGRRFDYQVPVPQYDSVPRYTVSTATLDARLRNNLRMILRTENLFDSKYQEFVGFPSPGIYASAGLQLTLGSRDRKNPDVTSGYRNDAAWR
ncbi:TonB-dependent receptor plug domain-containing protein [Acidicapsa acidisoli]|uniref:TonB-dependent receptor plug domain-containing protein n=1 Tax=Acidicapsa acidisoli TaxID=1615681 RepID=UPI0021DFEAB4|nr:TonB-dependent receptor [Acidicapsa acidisoli]